MDVAGLIREWSDDLVNDATAVLRQARLTHYEADGDETLHNRVATFIARTVDSLSSGRAEPLVEHANSIARERYAAGYELGEVQIAINVIEEALWGRILSSLGPEEVAHALGLVNAVFGMAKDRLAQTYVELTANREHS